MSSQTPVAEPLVALEDVAVAAPGEVEAVWEVANPETREVATAAVVAVGAP